MNALTVEFRCIQFFVNSPQNCRMCSHQIVVISNRRCRIESSQYGHVTENDELTVLTECSQNILIIRNIRNIQNIHFVEKISDAFGN